MDEVPYSSLNQSLDGLVRKQTIRPISRSEVMVLTGLVLIHFALTGFLTCWYAPTQDETAHLPAGLAIYRFDTTDLYRVNPPLVRAVAALPLLWFSHVEDWSHYVPGAPRRSEWDVGADFFAANGSRSIFLYRLARWACLPFSLIGLFVCWCWGREQINALGGVIAAGLWCFSPNLIGHGALITPDVAAVSLGLLAAWRFQHWLQRPTWRNAVVAGVCLGPALLSKTYWVILLGMWPVMAMLSFELRSRFPSTLKGQEQTRDDLLITKKRLLVVQMVTILVIGLNLLNLGYGYRGTGTRLGEFEFFSETLSGMHRDLELDRPGNRFQDGWVGWVPVPFPRDYVSGIDIQKHDFEQPHWSYLMGQRRRSGWWFYYLIGLAVKVPLGTWCLVLMGVWVGARGKDAWTRLLNFLPLWGPVLVLLFIASIETGMNRHVRYVFPVLPMLYLIAGQCALMDRKWLIAPPFLAVLLASLFVYPHSLSFFNLAVGGPSRGHRVLIDSNLDWGQDLLQVRRWLRNHPQCRPVTVASVASYPTSAIGISAPRTPPGPPVAGWHLISVHLLNGYSDSYSEYRKLRPVDRVGWTFNIYHVVE